MKNIRIWVVLLFCLLFGFTITVFAVELPASGNLANGAILWSIDSNGALTISGSGAIAPSLTYPWEDYASQIKTITVGNGITSLPIGVFKGCDNLIEISLPFVGTSKTATVGVFGAIFGSSSSSASGTVDQSYGHYYIPKTLRTVTITDAKTIPDHAFYNCDFITEINLNNGITSISAYAFYHCKGLTEISIPETVTSIGSYAFSSCTGLTELFIPESVTSIGSSAFSICSGLTKVSTPSLEAWCGITFADNCANPLYYAHHLYINGSELTELTIPASFGSVKAYAFYGCTGLTSLTLEDGVTGIGRDAFRDCAGLTSVTIPASVSEIPAGLFQGCSSLEEMTLPFVGISESAAHNYDRIFGAIFGATYSTDAKATSVFGTVYQEYGRNEKAYADVYYYYRFYCIPKTLRKVTVTNAETIPDHAFYNCDFITEINLNDGITSISAKAFYNCAGLLEISIPNSVTSIGNDAFNGCTGLTAVYVNSIEYWLSLTFPNVYANPLLYAHNLYIDGELLTELTIPTDVTKINPYAFYAATCLKKLTVPANVTTYGSVCFEDAGIEELIIGYGTETIPASAFENCTSLAKLTLPNTMKSIGSDAFSGCFALSTGTVSYNECLVEWRKINIALPNYEIIAAEKEFCAYDIINGYPAKCETTGLTDGYQCTLCRAIVVERQVIPATGHALSSETIGPTCVDDGIIIITCAFCDHEEKTILPALHHIEVVDPYVAPTCLACGYTTGSHCSRCNAILEEQIELAALGHNWSTWIKINDSEHERTCLRCSACEHGAHNRVYGKCTVCGDDNVSSWLSCKGVTIDFPRFVTGSRVGIALYEENGRMLQYVSSKWGKTQQQSFAVDADLNASYLKIFSLNENADPLRDTISMKVTDELGKHSYVEDDETAATCTRAGIKRITCVACGDSHTEEIPALGHTPVEAPAVPATCSSHGLTAGEICSVCGEAIIAQQETPMTAHSWTDADCTHPKTCTVCGTTSGQPLGHNCTAANGYTCSRCGYKMLNSITLNMNSGTTYVGGTVALSFTTNPLGADYSSVTWNSDNTSVATVDSSGRVKGVSNGTATIKLTVENQYSGKKVATCTVTVKNPTVMLAINPNLSATSLSSSSLYSTDPAGQLSSLDTMPKLDASREVSDTYVDENGETITITSIPWDYEMEQGEEQKRFIKEQQEKYSAGTLKSTYGSSYSVGSTKKIYDDIGSTRYVKCLYIGSHCTVWSCTSDDYRIQITSSIASEIGREFDSKYSAIISNFGNWYDADGDGKLAIFCYDIDKDIINGVRNSYTGGFFSPQDLVGVDDKTNGLSTGLKHRGMGLDCIHIDTYPAMGYSKYLEDYESVYSTLIHECQHLINYSYQVLGGFYYGSMETYLNEAMSMAAEHMINGSNATSSRITYFNSKSDYLSGCPLTYWDGDLSNYSNSYLFGQYIRTRYAQLTNDGQNGGTIYKQVMQKRQNQGGGDTLQIIADLLQTSKTQLVVDFWSAVYFKERSGIHGFNGESWANAIHPIVLSDKESALINGIYNGGCRFFSVSSAKYKDGRNLKVIYY